MPEGPQPLEAQLRPLRHLDVRGPPAPAPARRAQHRLRLRELLGAALGRRRVPARPGTRVVWLEGFEHAGRALGALRGSRSGWRSSCAAGGARGRASTRARRARPSRSSTWACGTSSCARNPRARGPRARGRGADRQPHVRAAPQSRSRRPTRPTSWSAWSRPTGRGSPAAPAWRAPIAAFFDELRERAREGAPAARPRVLGARRRARCRTPPRRRCLPACASATTPRREVYTVALTAQIHLEPAAAPARRRHARAAARCVRRARALGRHRAAA